MSDRISDRVTQAQLIAEIAHLQAQLAQLQATTPAAQNRNFQRVNRALWTLSNFNRALVRITNATELLQQLCRTLVSAGGYELAWIGFRQDDANSTVLPVAQAGDDQGYVETLPITWADTIHGQGPTGTAIRTGQPQMMRFIATDPDYAPWRAAALERGYQSSIALPLLNSVPELDEPDRDASRAVPQAFGCLNIYATEPDAFDSAEVDLLKELAGDLVYGLTALRHQQARRQAEANLQVSEARLLLALRAAQMGIWDWSIDTGEITWSPGHEDLFGLASGTFDGRYETFDACLHPDDRPGLNQALQAAITQHQPYHHEYRVVWPDGTVHWVEGKGQAFYDATTGQAVRMTGTVMAISDRKQAELDRQASVAQYQLLFAANPNPMWIIDTETLAFLAVNQAAINHYGYTAAEFLAMTILDIRPPQDVPLLLQDFRQPGHPEIYRGTWRHCKKDGTLIDVEVTSHRLTWLGRTACCAILKDVTAQLAAMHERDRATAVLQATHTEMQALFAAMTDIVLVRDAQGRCLRIAPTNLQNLYQPVAQQLGKTVHETMPPAQADLVMGLIQQALTIQQPVYGEYSLPIGDRTLYFSTAVSPLSEDTVMLVAHNITPRKQAEDALRSSEEQFRVAFEQSPVAMVLAGLERQFLKLNQAYCHLFGYTNDELLAITFVELTHPDDLALDLAFTAQLVKGEIAYFQIEKRFFHKTGRLIYGLLSVALVRDANGQPSHVIGQIIDITTRKQAEQVLRQTAAQLEIQVANRTATLTTVNHQLQQELQERQTIEQTLRQNQTLLQAIVDNSPAVIYLNDPNHCLILANRQYADLFELQPDQIVGRSIDDILPAAVAARCRAANEVVLTTGKPLEIEAVISTVSGPRTYVVMKFPLFDPAEQIYAVGGIATDITERSVIARMKDEFMAIVSHELRTPLMSIHTALNLFADGLLNPQSVNGQQAMRIAAKGTDRLVYLVNDILDLERLESGHLSFIRQPWDLAVLMIQASEQMQVMADQAGITLVVHPWAVTVKVDGDRLMQVFTNLLSNAIKFSPSGSTVWLQANLDREVEPEFILIQVRDQGRGIAPEQLETIFDRFYQAHVADTHRRGGLGLGLAICRNIVHHHGGKIWAESTRGKGSCFYIKLPLLPA